MAITQSKTKKITTKKEAARKKSGMLRYVVLDSENHLLEQLENSAAIVCKTKQSVLDALDRTDAESLWISRCSGKTEELAKTIVERISTRTQRRTSFGNLLALEASKSAVRPTLEGLFDHVVGVSRGFKRLSLEELMEVLSSAPDERTDIFIGGVLNREFGTLVLVRGNLERIIVPLSMFRPSGKSVPNFSKFELGDYGRTLRFGEYEATSDVVLWEFDLDYRKREKANRRAHAKGFGPSLRRLRKQRGMAQSGFRNVARKTISRIENGEVKPHGITLDRIARALGVAPDEIETY